MGINMNLWQPGISHGRSEHMYCTNHKGSPTQGLDSENRISFKMGKHSQLCSRPEIKSNTITVIYEDNTTILDDRETHDERYSKLISAI